ncbi:MAG TPA: peptidoglycan DD-metalloendopeptidase family protein [Puia sp.]|nr:peptidoglycan DD-metalloendopeptidase family protein [Puia sp.]
MKFLFTVAIWLLSGAAYSQQSSLFRSPDYPQGYFRDPLDIPMSLAANFGELRPGHYHMGLDIRTQHRENLPVHAAADGYVERVTVSPGGFGQAVYLRHPNGYSTVYGHLNRFFPALARYVSEAQYRQQSWQVDLTIPPGLFPVKKGQLIAYSGNTGGSQGPHLHFEIRRTAGDINLNPLLFGLPVPDKVPPVILRLAWYNGDKGIYGQSPQILPVHRLRALPAPPRPPLRLSGRVPGSSASGTNRSGFGKGGQRGTIANYALSETLLVVPVPRIGFAISASDAQSGSKNPNGIYRAVLSADDNPVIGFQLDGISYDNTGNINAHIDYKTRESGGPFLQQLFFLPGYPFPSIYRIPGNAGGIDPAAKDAVQRAGTAASGNDGFLDISDGLPHAIDITVTDPQGNRASLPFKVEYQPGVTGKQSGMAMAGKMFYPGMVDGVEATDFAFYLGEKSLYDSVRIAAGEDFPGEGFPDGVSPVVGIGEPDVPLADPMLVRLRLPDSAAAAYPPGAGRDRIVMVRFQKNDREVIRPEWRGNWASARFSGFGHFQLVADSTAPEIIPLGPLQGADLAHAARIAFRVTDNLGGLRRFRAELDGHWLCFTNDKRLAWIYKFDSHCPQGPHTLTVTVEDTAGNRREETYHFNR